MVLSIISQVLIAIGTAIVAIALIISVAIYKVRKEQGPRIIERETKVSQEIRTKYEKVFEGRTLDERGRPIPKVDS